MHVAVTGSSGLIGSALRTRLVARGHTVTRLVRRPANAADELSWDPQGGTVDRDRLHGVDAVVHLAGESITSGLWTAERKRRIRISRVQGTRVLAEALAGMDDGPRVLVSASGINYYGDRGDEALTSDSAPGTGFLADVVRDWEAATRPAADAGLRVVHVRTGISLVPRGGIGLLQVTGPLFKLGLGGRLGSGRQYWSWVTLDDIIGIYEHALVTEELSGPVNAVAPNPVTNADYTRTLAKVVGRPAFFYVPAFLPKSLAGELATELLFTSMRVLPERVLATGYAFRHTNLEEALRDLLDRPV